jgi:sec-independent protein translocase protein TatA
MFEGILQPTHLILILVIVLILFGPGKLPQIGSAIGQSIREFRHGIREATSDERPSEPPEDRHAR